MRRRRRSTPACKRWKRSAAAIHTEQKRIRENLQAIGDRAGEKELRERYLKTLNAQEDRLEKIDNETAAQIKARDACREKIKRAPGQTGI